MFSYETKEKLKNCSAEALPIKLKAWESIFQRFTGANFSISKLKKCLIVWNYSFHRSLLRFWVAKMSQRFIHTNNVTQEACISFKPNTD